MTEDPLPETEMPRALKARILNEEVDVRSINQGSQEEEPPPIAPIAPGSNENTVPGPRLFNTQD